jgi:hypothetical protein
VSSFSGLRSLALVAGWSAAMAPLLPLTIDAYAMSATRVWLADATASARARRFARNNAVGAILASLLGNATYHAIAAGLVRTSWAVVVVVGAVPPVVLGLVSHLAVLRKQSDPPVPQSVPSTTPELESGTRYGSADELLAAARAADVAYRAEHDGKPCGCQKVGHLRGLRVLADQPATSAARDDRVAPLARQPPPGAAVPVRGVAPVSTSGAADASCSGQHIRSAPTPDGVAQRSAPGRAAPVVPCPPSALHKRWPSEPAPES